ncbi:MAG: nucleotidyl transferase AbiEii/AbiGii toxin family protein [Lachnospiraceae bacterium]|nr:nucleotidyl transferase AbiEii/AbiGii toxin family protein [Lachnospiraceae bacterium]
MISTAIQLKAKIRNVSKGNDRIAKSYIRIYFMERFMERVSLSKYRDNFILKGGMLVSSLLGIDLRSTMDIDTTVESLPLTKEYMLEVLDEICNIELEDNIVFKVVKIENIMDDFEYPGLRINMEATLEKLRQPVKIDISTNDKITPSAIEYEYKLMFEDRSILLNTYNIETTLAEKTQTIISRGTANTRMRDFYDIYKLEKEISFSVDVLKEAFKATCVRRGTEFTDKKILEELKNISDSSILEELWNNYTSKNYYVGKVQYKEVVEAVQRITNMIIALAAEE